MQRLLAHAYMPPFVCRPLRLGRERVISARVGSHLDLWRYIVEVSIDLQTVVGAHELLSIAAALSHVVFGRVQSMQLAVSVRSWVGTGGTTCRSRNAHFSCSNRGLRFTEHFFF